MTGKRVKCRRKIRQRSKIRRENMSPTRLALIRERDRLKKIKYTSNLTLEQLEIKREKDRIHKRVKRESMSQTERLISRERDRVRQKIRREKMTVTERDAERERDRIRKRLIRSAKAGVFSFGTKNSDLWRMELNSWTFDNIDNPWTLPSYANVSDIMEAAFCVVNMQQNIVEEFSNSDWPVPSEVHQNPLSVTSDEEKDCNNFHEPHSLSSDEQEDISNFHNPLLLSSNEGEEDKRKSDDWVKSDYAVSDNIGIKMFDFCSTDSLNTTEHGDGCVVDLITPEVILTTDNET